MAFIFVSKSGNDFSPGTAEAPKLTITAALSGAVNGDTIIIRAGVYKETAAFKNINYSVTMSGMGYVVIDGEGVRTNCVTLSSTGSGGNRFVGIHFRRSTGTLIKFANGSNFVSYEYCEFSEAPQVTDGAAWDMFNCLTRDMQSSNLGAWVYDLTTANKVFDNTFENIPSISGAIRYSSTSAFTPAIYRNVWNRCQVPIQFHSTSMTPSSMDYNIYDFGFPGTVIRRGGAAGNIFTSLAAWQAVNAQTDPHSISASGEFNDLHKRLLSPRPGGNMTYLDPNGGAVGALRTGLALSNNINQSLFASGTFENTQVNASGNIELTASPTGAVTFQTADLGAVVRLHAIRVSTLFEDYPTDVVDADITDSNPNELNVEYRSSTVSQANAQAQAWTKLKRSIAGQMTFPSGTLARWVQLRITLRTNGVSA